ncbi:MAG: efflux RND transporter periplasmic adaptor subunit [Acidobacteriota bacterium]
MKKVWIALIALLLLGGAAAGVNWGVRQLMTAVEVDKGTQIPTTTVRKGRVTITVTARGELQGGNSEMMIVPPTGSGDAPITFLRPTGDVVNSGDVIIEFDTTQQEYNLREAEADLAEAQAKVLQAEADAAAALEESRWTTISTAAEVEFAGLEARKNPILAVNVARQNDIALAAARNRKEQSDRDFKNRQSSSDATINIQRANANKSKLLADNAKRIIDSLVLKSKTGGYVHVLGNSSGQLLYSGATVPDFQVGDMARAGQTIAQIPDMSTWEVSASIPEVDRGYLAVGQKAEIRPSVLAGSTLKGHVAAMGGTTGTSSSRRFLCRIAVDKADPALRPGMTTYVTITVDTLENVLWLPSQALFESDGRAYVYVSGAPGSKQVGFVQKEVTLLRRGESQTVIKGLDEGTRVALSRPDQQSKGGDAKGNSVMKALTK